jgi:hypothetical protein
MENGKVRNMPNALRGSPAERQTGTSYCEKTFGKCHRVNDLSESTETQSLMKLGSREAGPTNRSK